MKTILSMFLAMGLAAGIASCAESDAPQTSAESDDLTAEPNICSPGQTYNCIDTPDQTCCRCGTTGEWHCYYKGPIATP